MVILQKHILFACLFTLLVTGCNKPSESAHDQVLEQPGSMPSGQGVPEGQPKAVSEDAVSKVKVGMTEHEVRTILGEPTNPSVTTKDGRTVTGWTYDRQGPFPYVSIFFEHGRVISVR